VKGEKEKEKKNIIHSYHQTMVGYLEADAKVAVSVMVLEAHTKQSCHAVDDLYIGTHYETM
jgi:cell division protein FtsI/penicillin-binding protein 2